MGVWEALAALLGLAIVLLVAAALRRNEFDAEAPKYEMLGRTPPREAPPRRPGRLGPVDRVVRLGVIGAAAYYAGRLGWGTPGGLLLATAGLYLLLTGIAGRDPFYRLFRRRNGAPAP